MTAAHKQPAKSPGRRPGRPRHLDKMSKINTARHIMQHAKLLFARKGYSAVSIHDIVTAAEISKPTLYYYFPDKEQLYSAVLSEIIEHAGQNFGEIMARTVAVEQKLLTLAEAFFEHAPTSLPCLIRDVSQHLSEPAAERVLAHYRERIFQPFRQLFEEAIAQGEIHNGQSPWLLSEFFLTLLDWLNLRFSFHDGKPLDNREKAVQVVRLFLDGAATLNKPL